VLYCYKKYTEMNEGRDDIEIDLVTSSLESTKRKRYTRNKDILHKCFEKR
jgi:hypothetical protein